MYLLYGIIIFVVIIIIGLLLSKFYKPLKKRSLIEEYQEEIGEEEEEYEEPIEKTQEEKDYEVSKEDFRKMWE